MTSDGITELTITTMRDSRLTVCFAHFQYIEESIRCFIALSMERLAKLAKANNQYYSPDTKRLDKDSLGKLVSKLEMYVDSKELLDELKELVPKRNQLAHSCFVNAKLDYADIVALNDRAEKMCGKLTPIVEALCKSS